MRFRWPRLTFLLPLGALLILFNGCSKDLAVAPLKRTTLDASSGPGSGGGTPAASTIALSPTSVVGGASSTATVTLSAAAPAGGTVVSVTSSNTAAATTPASITIPAGSAS